MLPCRLRNGLRGGIDRFDHEESYSQYHFVLAGLAQHANGASPYRTVWQKNGYAKTFGEYASDIISIEIDLLV